jgi:phage terminase large subunit GpA-like protein
MFYDEPGKYPSFAGKEADPFSLGDVRTNVFPYTSKQIYFSTPNLSGDGFDKLLTNEPDETRRFHAKCPFCDEMQIMQFRNFHWGGEDDYRRVVREKLARYKCPHCEKDWDDFARDYAIKSGRGRWIAKDPIERPMAIAFGPLESWHSPLISLSKATAAYLRSRVDPSKKQAWINQHKALPWKHVLNTKTEAQLLKHKNDMPPGVVPDWAVALTAGIDMQSTGFWFVVRAWDGDLNNHLVQYGFLSTFDDVEALVFKTHYGKFPIWRAALDTGGTKPDEDKVSRTEEAYQFLVQMKMKYGDRVLYGIKGASRVQFQLVSPPREIDKMPSWKGKKIKGMLELRTLDTFNLKKLLHDRLALSDESVDDKGKVVEVIGQKMSLHSETGMDYAKQFMAEELQKDRNGKSTWVETGANHLFDAEVYAAACADMSWQPGLQMVAQYLKAQSVAAVPGQAETKGRGIRSRGIG